MFKQMLNVYHFVKFSFQMLEFEFEKVCYVSVFSETCVGDIKFSLLNFGVK